MTACSTAAVVGQNIRNGLNRRRLWHVQDPREEKFRRIRLGNAAFQARVGGVEGALRFLELLGFQRDAAGECLVMPADKVPDPCLVQSCSEHHAAVHVAA